MAVQADETASIQIEVGSLGNPGVNDTLMTTTLMVVHFGVGLEVADDTVLTEQGTTVSFQVDLENTGNVLDTIRCRDPDSPGGTNEWNLTDGWTVSLQLDHSLAPGNRTTTDLEIDIPVTLEPTRWYTLFLRCWSTRDREPHTEAEGTYAIQELHLEVRPAVTLEVVGDPLVVQPGVMDEIQFSVTKNGNSTDLSFYAIPDPYPPGWTFEVSSTGHSPGAIPQSPDGTWEADETRPVFLWVTPSEGALADETVDITAQAIHPTLGLLAEVGTMVQVDQVYDLEVSVGDGQSLELEAGSETNVPLRVTNRGNGWDNYSMTVESPSSWTALVPMVSDQEALHPIHNPFQEMDLDLSIPSGEADGEYEIRIIVGSEGQIPPVETVIRVEIVSDGPMGLSAIVNTTYLMVVVPALAGFVLFIFIFRKGRDASPMASVKVRKPRYPPPRTSPTPPPLEALELSEPPFLQD
jgi:hypothetical protein